MSMTQDLSKLLLAGAIGAAATFGVVSVDKGGSPPAAPTLLCPAHWTRTQVGQLQDTNEEYAACERGDYNLTLTSAGFVLYRIWPLAEYHEITDPSEKARIIVAGE